MLTYEVARDLAAQQVRYAELTMTPYTSVVRGIPIEAYTEAIEDARVAAERDHGVRAALDLRHPGRVRAASRPTRPCPTPCDHRPEALVGFGLGGPEIGVPRAAVRAALRPPPAPPGCTRCRTPASRPGPQSVWDALTLLGAERIGHGTSSVQDPALLAHLAEHGIPLEVCPTSNIATRVVERIEEHPIRAMRDAGVVVTVNSDDPPMFGTTLNREYEIAAGLLDLDDGRRRRPRPGRRRRQLRPGCREGVTARGDRRAPRRRRLTRVSAAPRSPRPRRHRRTSSAQAWIEPSS